MGLNIVVIMSLFMLPLSGWLCHSSKLTEFKEEFEEAVKKVGANLVQTTPYYPEAN
jgi:hypothetical protein